MNLTVMLISHSMEDVARLADRILVLNHGKVEMFGTPSEVFKNSDRLSKIGLSVPQITKVISILRSEGIDIESGIYTTGDAYRVLLPLLQNKNQTQTV